MTARDFCYWLQGFFEIYNRPIDKLTYYQVVIIEKHLKMVTVCEPQTTNRFYVFIKNTLNFLKDDNGSLSKSAIDLIRLKLNNEFIHVIDPSMGDEQQLAVLNKLHNGDKTTMRC
jgi:hypothetical protein